MSLTQFRHSLLSLPRLAKRILAVLCDTVLCAAAVYLAFLLHVGADHKWHIGQTLAWFVGVFLSIPIFSVFGLYRAIFRHLGFQSLIVVAKASAIYGVVYALIFSVARSSQIPIAIGVLQPLLYFVLVMSSRMLIGYLLGEAYRKHIRGDITRVLIYGAGAAGRQLASGLVTGGEVRVCGYLDDDDRLHGQVLNGLKIYNPKLVLELITQKQIDEIYLAMPSASRVRRNEIVDALRETHVQVRTIPGLFDLAKGHISVSELRELDIEDLLGRDPVPPNPLLLTKMTQDKVVVVTGAGGSIGSELCRQLVKSQPKILLLVEMSEFALYAIHHELEQACQASATPIVLVPLLADVEDAARIREIFETWKPCTVYHAAAYKHVPLVEHNPLQGIKNNVFGTLTCVDQAIQQGVQNFVLISTDKAVRPTNVMGASKRLAEMVLQAKAETQSVTRLCMVRFGNVLGSSGSVVPLFRKQIKAGGPITLTDPRMTRYFMTIPEAAELVIQAGAMAEGGDVFVLDMGEPVRIFDLACRMIELSGLSLKDEDHLGGDIEITCTGLRPGEKLYEELLIGDNPLRTLHPRIMRANEKFLSWDELRPKLDHLMERVAQHAARDVWHCLKELVSDYQPESEIVDWVVRAREKK